MITVTPTSDVQYIDRVIHDPAVLPGLFDDYSKPLADISMSSVIDKIDGVFLKVDQDGAEAGLFIMNRKSPGVYEIHTALLPSCRGSAAVRAGRAVLAWAFKNLDCREITSYSLSDAPHVLRYAKWCGLHETGTEPYIATRNGKKVNITHLSILIKDFNST